MTDAPWNYRAGEGRWTIAEVAGHLAAAETMIRDMATSAMKEPATAEMLTGARKDEAILNRIPDRGKKFQAPEPLKPTNRFQTPAAAVQAFRTERAVTRSERHTKQIEEVKADPGFPKK